jgi:hypothetical protein
MEIELKQFRFTDPFSMFDVAEHKVMGTFNPTKMSLVSWDGTIPKNAANLFVIQHLLDHWNLIPKEWVGKNIYCVGTILKYPANKKRFVINLFAYSGRWGWDFKEIKDKWNENDYILITE